MILYIAFFPLGSMVYDWQYDIKTWVVKNWRMHGQLESQILTGLISDSPL